MASFNKVLLIGNLTRDPEVRATPKGTTVCSFSLAMNRRYRTEGGEDRDETTFVDIESYGKQAELIGKYLSKGRPLMVEGRLKLDSWEKNGEKRSRLKVVMENFQFMGGRDDNSGSDYESVSPASRRSSSSVEDDDEIPF